MASAWSHPNESVVWARPIDGLVMCAPALEPSMTMTQRPCCQPLAAWCPICPVPVGLKADWCSSDPKVVADILADPSSTNASPQG